MPRATAPLAVAHAACLVPLAVCYLAAKGFGEFSDLHQRVLYRALQTHPPHLGCHFQLTLLVLPPQLGASGFGDAVTLDNTCYKSLQSHLITFLNYM